MPIVEIAPEVTPYLVYDAPVDEKTKKIREMFKVDEKTGYPEHYNWRSVARLGNRYLPQDPFLKFDGHDSKSLISQKVTMGLLFGGAAAFTHYAFSLYLARPWWTRLYIPVFGATVMTGLGLWIQEKTYERQGIRNAITVDYLQKHPERFGEIHRPKVREVLFEHVPVR